MLQLINPNNFTWQIWKGGCLLDLGLQTRFADIVDNKDILQQYAIGYCKGEEVPCRPKTGSYAVMFQKEDIVFWTHLLKNEFEKVFLED